MITTALAATLGAAIGATAIGVASAAAGNPHGLAVALQHIPTTAHGSSVVSAVQTALAGGTGGGIGAAVSVVAKALGNGAATVVGR